MSILLTDIIKFKDTEDCKLHLASWNGANQPLDIFVKDKAQWQQWNEYRSEKDDFNKKYIFSLIDFYPEKDTWLFGGIFEVLERSDKKQTNSYIVKLIESDSDLIGRLKVILKRPGRAKSLKFDNHLENIVVSEILKQPYSGELFCGYENINHDFSMMENIINTDRKDWRAALENIKGVYLIMDKSNGMKYVGSAYGDSGIWSRWKCYIKTGHGWNDEMTKIIKKESIDYARKNFIFSLLEYRSMKADDDTIIKRETYWKDILFSREPYGYNKN